MYVYDAISFKEAFEWSQLSNDFDKQFSPCI